METLKRIWNFLFNHKTIYGKQWIEESMSETWGEDWLEQCMDGLRNSKVRKNIADELGLKG